MKLKEDHVFLTRGKVLRDFHLPRWSELPAEEMLRQPMLDYIEQALVPLFPERAIITALWFKTISNGVWRRGLSTENIGESILPTS